MTCELFIPHLKDVKWKHFDRVGSWESLYISDISEHLKGQLGPSMSRVTFSTHDFIVLVHKA